MGRSVLVDGQPLAEMDHPVLTALVHSDRVVVLLDPDSVPGNVGVFLNLIGLDSATGDVAWVGTLPTNYTGDCYISVDLDMAQLVAVSWSGWKVRVDLSSGSIEDREFLK